MNANVKYRAVVFIILSVGFGMQVNGQVRWSVDFNFGLPVNIPAVLTISQDGKPDQSLRAVWSAEPFIRPYNWMWRIGRWNDNKAWEFETVHHKLVLQNRPDNVQWLSITHGFNTASINRAWRYQKFIVRTGAGCVLAHPESTIDNMAFNQESGLFKWGYYLTGPVVMTSAARPINVSKWFLINLEGKMTAGYANVPIIHGRAKLLHLAFHLNAGLGFSFRGRSRTLQAD